MSNFRENRKQPGNQKELIKNWGCLNEYLCRNKE
jgi:hypothetical protein